MIIGTAGHVDHGKSSLITALTGRPTDRLAEERRRGITIDLGFTTMDLGDGRRASIVDVPGHEDFIRTMVAGASGIDTAMLAVAADDGIMPQSREHLAVMEALGIPVIVPVVTKADLADPGWLDLVTSEVQDWLGKSPLRALPPMTVSVRDGRGLGQLRSTLAALGGQRVARRPDDLFRMPVDRAFVIPGAGVVVTGATWSGTIRDGDEIEIHPTGITARVRRIEVHGDAVAEAPPGSRTALALAGIGLDDVGRGSTLVQAGAGWVPIVRVVVRIALGRDMAVPVRVRDLRLSLGTADVVAHSGAGEALLQPGEVRVAMLRLDRALVARGGDRLVLRHSTSGRVIGAGMVLDPLPPARGATRRSTEVTLQGLSQVRRWGLTGTDAAIAGGVVPADAAGAMEREGLVALGGRWFTPARVEELEAAIITTLEASHTALPTERGMPMATLLARLAAPGDTGRALLEQLVGRGRVRITDGLVHLAGFAPRPVSGADAGRLLAEVRRDGLEPRKASELPGEPAARDRLLRELVAGRQVVPLVRDRFVSVEALEGFRAVLQRCGSAGAITPAAVRDATGLSRKHLIPLLEWADRAGVTVRRGDARALLAPRA